MRNILTFILFLMAIPFNIVLANNESTDFMREMGKMYVVVAVIVTTFIGIFIYLIRLDNKLSKMEKKMKTDSLSKR
jgi:CcmD family protein